MMVSDMIYMVYFGYESHREGILAALLPVLRASYRNNTGFTYVSQWVRYNKGNIETMKEYIITILPQL